MAPSISIVMPALDEQDNIRDAVADTLITFDGLKIDGQVIVIDDGSTDRTGEIVSEMSKEDSRVRLIRNETPQGIGGAFWAGVKKADGEFICLLPGDGQIYPSEILRYFPLTADVDIVVPHVFDKGIRAPIRNIISKLYVFIVDATFGVTYKYTNGAVIYRKTLLKNLDYQSPNFFFQTDILVRLAKMGYLYAEVPYRIRLRTGGGSKAVSLSSLKQIIGSYLRLARDIFFNRRKFKNHAWDAKSATARRYNESRKNLKPDVEK